MWQDRSGIPRSHSELRSNSSLFQDTESLEEYSETLEKHLEGNQEGRSLDGHGSSQEALKQGLSAVMIMIKEALFQLVVRTLRKVEWTVVWQVIGRIRSQACLHLQAEFRCAVQ